MGKLEVRTSKYRYVRIFFLIFYTLFSFSEKVIKKDGEEEIKKSPVKSSSIPNHIPYLLIGGGPASFSAFRSIKSRDPKAKVLIITEEYYHPYMKPPLSKEVWYDKERKGASEFTFKQWQGTPRRYFAF